MTSSVKIVIYTITFHSKSIFVNIPLLLALLIWNACYVSSNDISNGTFNRFSESSDPIAPGSQIEVEDPPKDVDKGTMETDIVAEGTTMRVKFKDILEDSYLAEKNQGSELLLSTKFDKDDRDLGWEKYNHKLPKEITYSEERMVRKGDTLINRRYRRDANETDAFADDPSSGSGNATSVQPSERPRKRPGFFRRIANVFRINKKRKISKMTQICRGIRFYYKRTLGYAFWKVLGIGRKPFYSMKTLTRRRRTRKSTGRMNATFSLPFPDFAECLYSFNDYFNHGDRSMDPDRIQTSTNYTMIRAPNRGVIFNRTNTNDTLKTA